jgi:hypothetical protein
MGVSQELLSFCEGSAFTLHIRDIRFDTNEEKKEIEFVSVKEDKVYNNRNITGISTENKLEAFHVFYNNDEIKSKGYLDTTSNIITGLLNEYGYKFKSNNIIDSSDNALFLQPLINDVDFIEKNIIPNAYASDETAYFCFIDNFNNFNYTTYKSMMDAEAIATISDLQKSNTEMERNSILNYSILNTGSELLKPHRSKYNFTFLNDGTNEELETKIFDFIPDTDKILPIVNNKDHITSYYNIDNTGYTDEDANNIKGRFIYNNQAAYFVERLRVTTTYNNLYAIGKKIKLALHLAGNDSIVESKYYTGDYLIEVNSIIWDNKSKNLFNDLIISRCKFEIDDSIYIKDKLMKR